MIVDFVSSEVYRRIENYVRRISGAYASAYPCEHDDGGDETGFRTTHEQCPTPLSFSAPSVTATVAPDSKPPSEANPVAAATSKPENTIAASPNPWETLRVGARVLAAYWNEKARV